MCHSTPSTYLVWSMVSSLVRPPHLLPRACLTNVGVHSSAFSWFIISGVLTGSSACGELPISFSSAQPTNTLPSWNQGSQGTFKRLMTVRAISRVPPFSDRLPQYSYLLSVPLIITYSVGFCVIKYKEGYMILPVYGGTSIPIPPLASLPQLVLSRARSLPNVDTRTQKCHLSLVSLSFGGLGTRNVRSPCHNIRCNQCLIRLSVRVTHLEGKASTQSRA